MSASAWVHSGALFSPCRTYRYSLWRAWAPGPRVTWIMLNPSTADETVEDPTIRRCIGYARAWGYGGVEIVNLFALRSTDPAALRTHPDPIGPGNDDAITNAAGNGRVVCGWGVHGAFMDRGRAVRRSFDGVVKLHCMGLTKDGHPKHPLYLRGDVRPMEMP